MELQAKDLSRVILEPTKWLEHLSLSENVSEIMDRYDVSCPLEDINCKEEIDSLIEHFK